MHTSKNKYLPFFMWLLPLSFFAFQFILRLWPGLMMHQIMAQFSINASHFGMLAAFYYYGYSGMQIPVAILLERFSPRQVIFVFATLCGLATLIFTYTDNFYIAVLSRFLIGAGSAVGFLGVSKVVSEWFPKDQYARMIGFSFTLGLMGAIYGGKPISLLIQNHKWQSVALALGTISIAIGLTSYLVLRSPSNKPNAMSEPLKLSNLRSILKSPSVWLLAFSNLLMVGSLEGFADVWGVPYLMKAHNLDTDNAAGLISFVFFGMLFGGPLLAWLSSKFGNYSVITVCGFGMSLAFIFLLLNKSHSLIGLSCLFFVIGVMCCYQVIVFAAGSELVQGKNLGICIAFLNSINMLGGSFFHTSIGRAMDMFWSGEMSAGGVKLYSLTTYKYALSIIPLCALIGGLMVLSLRLLKKPA